MLSFQSILAHQSQLAWLSSALAADRLPHGLIFGGPAGVGKGTVARILAARFLCSNPQGAEPCNACDNCVAMNADAHPDYHRVFRQLIRQDKDKSKARDLSVDVIRDYVVAAAKLTSMTGAGKVFIIEEAELMSASAQNALLKVLEEPASKTLFVLLADDATSLLPTIRSRSQILRFGPIDRDTLITRLKHDGFDPRLAAAAADMTGGSLGRSIQWINDGVVERGLELHTRLEAVARTSNPADLGDFMKKSADAAAAAELTRDKDGSKDQFTRDALIQYLQLSADYFRTKLPQTEDGEALERLCRAIDAATDTERLVASNVNVALALQSFSVTLRECFAPHATATR